MSDTWKSVLAPLPLIAILRGLRPENAESIVGALRDAGFRAVEVPLNSPEPLKSIEIAQRAFGEDMLVGAGTVLSLRDVLQVRDAGGRMIVSPNADEAVIKATKSLNLISIPGVATPSEAFAAYGAGADMLKLFPAEILPPVAVKAWRAVLPPDLWLFAVGGINPQNMAPYLAAGANGFGLGSALFKSDLTADDVAGNAEKFISAYRSEMRS